MRDMSKIFDYIIVAVDFDGTICDDKTFPKIVGATYTQQKLIDRLIAMREAGHKVILNTCRGGKLLDEAVGWCKEKGLEFDAVNDNLPEVKKAFFELSGKVFANFYIDDRNVLPEEIN